MRLIPDNELGLEMVPKSDADWHTTKEFALTFDGYGLHGTFEKVPTSQTLVATTQSATLVTILEVHEFLTCSRVCS